MSVFSRIKDFVFIWGGFTIGVILLVGVAVKDSEADGKVDLNFSDADFTHPLSIDNTYMPLNVGDEWIYSAETDDGTEVDTTIVTSQYRNLGGQYITGGVNCRAVSDQVRLTNDVLNNELVEDTTDWYAQDDDGNVWYCGEDSTEYFYDDHGNPDGSSTAGSWNADMAGAVPGIVMLADPVVGASYQQEYLDGVAEDMAKVLRLNESVSIDFGDFDNCLVTKEWTPLENGSVGHKTYYPGLGMVTESELSGGKTVDSNLIDYIPATK